MNRSFYVKQNNAVSREQYLRYGKSGALVFMVLTLCLLAKASFGSSAAFDPTVLISVAEAVAMKGNDPRTIFVDVRSEQAFDRRHIPGSIQIPLHFVRTKKYLKSINVILINDGYDYASLISSGGVLNQQGYRVFVMAGGIASWHQNKGELTGDPLGQEELHHVPASVLLNMKAGNTGFIKTFVNISKLNFDTPFPGTLHLPITKPDEVGKLLRAIADQQLDEKSGILIFNQNGNYGHLSTVLASTPRTIFYLSDGFAAYTEYEKQHQAMLQPRDNRLKKVGGCTTCPPVSDHNDK